MAVRIFMPPPECSRIVALRGSAGTFVLSSSLRSRAGLPRIRKWNASSPPFPQRIPEPAMRLDRFHHRRDGPEFGPQGLDMGVDRAVEARAGVFPCRRHQLVARE